jgi:predicted RNA binding protein YcfA (HicA-like mRNA interferase family)
MPRPPQMNGIQVVKALEKLGFEKARAASGSHQVMEHADGRTTTVPVHRTNLAPGTMRNIMQQAGVTAEELKNPRQAVRAQEAEAEQAAEGQQGGPEGIFDPTTASAPAHLATGEQDGQPQRPPTVRHGKRGKRRDGR